MKRERRKTVCFEQPVKPSGYQVRPDGVALGILKEQILTVEPVANLNGPACCHILHFSVLGDESQGVYAQFNRSARFWCLGGLYYKAGCFLPVDSLGNGEGTLLKVDVAPAKAKHFGAAQGREQRQGYT